MAEGSRLLGAATGPGTGKTVWRRWQQWWWWWRWWQRGRGGERTLRGAMLRHRVLVSSLARVGLHAVPVLESHLVHDVHHQHGHEDTSAAAGLRRHPFDVTTGLESSERGGAGGATAGALLTTLPQRCHAGAGGETGSTASASPSPRMACTSLPTWPREQFRRRTVLGAVGSSGGVPWGRSKGPWAARRRRGGAASTERPTTAATGVVRQRRRRSE